MDKSNSGVAEKELDQIVERLVEAVSPLKIYLFGSFSNGTANEDSDFDFYIIVGDDAPNLTDLTAMAYKSIRDVRSRAVDILIATESQFEKANNKQGILGEVINKGHLLYVNQL